MQFKFGQWQQSIYWCENENFMDFTGTCYRPKHWSSTHVQAKPAFTTWLNLSFIDLWVNRESIRTNQHVQEQSVCSDSCWVAWPLYKLCARSLAWFWINSYKSSRTVAMKGNVTKPHRDLYWMIKLLLLIQRFFEQYLSENIIHFVIGQPLIAHFWRSVILSVLNYKFSVLTFLRSVDIDPKMCQEKVGQLLSMSDWWYVLIKILLSRILVCLVRLGWSLQVTWAIQQWKFSKKNQFKLQSFGYLSTLFSPHITT